MGSYFLYALLLSAVLHQGSALYCYRCAPSMPGCNEFNWRGMGWLGDACPEENDICVKLIERRGSEIQVTRDCLSNIEVMRTDVPPDRYEGCIPASPDKRLAQYVNHSIKAHDVKRNFFDETTYCFCFLDHRCNGKEDLKASVLLVTLSTLILSVFIKFL